MKPFERRAVNAYPYFKLSTWDARSFTWSAGRTAFPTEGLARAAAVRPGRYRITRVEASGYTESEPFTV